MLRSTAGDLHGLCCRKAGAGCLAPHCLHPQVLHPQVASPPLLSSRRPAGGGEGPSASTPCHCASALLCPARPLLCVTPRLNNSPFSTARSTFFTKGRVFPCPTPAPCKLHKLQNYMCIHRKKDSCQLQAAVISVVLLDSNEYLRSDLRPLLSSFLLMKHLSFYKSFPKSLDR